MLAKGIGSGDLLGGLLPELLGGVTAGAPHCRRLLERPLGSVAEAMASALPVADLRELGVQVDRRCLVLQPAWRSDEQMLARVLARPGGPADLTVVQFRGPLQAAAAAGCGTATAAQAIVRLCDLLTELLAVIRRRGAPQVWFAALGAPVAAAHCIDVAATARRAVGWPWARMLRVEQHAERAVVRATGHQALARLRACLPDTALAGATVIDRGPELLLLAPPSVAFSRDRVFARAPHAREGRGVVLTPWPLHTSYRLDLEGLGARVAMAAAAQARDRHPLAPASTPEPLPAAAETQLLPIDRHAMPAVHAGVRGRATPSLFDVDVEDESRDEGG